MKQFSKLVNGILCVCGGFLIQFSLGTIYTFGNMSPYVASYLRNRTKDTWVNSGHLVWIFSVAVISQAFTMPLGGYLEKKIGARLICLIGGWTMSLGTIATYFSIKTNLFSVIITYGLIFGIGTGLTYSVALATPMKWFPNRKGLVAGTVVAGYGLGSLIFNLVQTGYINPLDMPPNVTTTVERYFTVAPVLDNVPYCFLLIGGVYAILQLIGVILLMDSSSEDCSGEVLIPINNRKNGVVVEKQLVEKDTGDEERREYSSTFEKHEENPLKQHEFLVKESLKERRFWIIWATFFFNGVVIVAISSFYKSYGQTFIRSDKFFSTVGAVAAIFNAGGRLVWGSLLDMISYRKMMSALTILTATVMGSFYFSSIVQSKSGANAMYFIWVCMLFFCLAGSFAMFPAVTSQSFGNTNMAIIYGMIFSGYAAASLMGALIFSSLFSSIHYVGLFLVATGCSIISLIITQFFPTPLTCDIPDKQAHE